MFIEAIHLPLIKFRIIMNTGKVKFFNVTKGFGFVISDDDQKEYFVHATGLTDKIQDNDDVVFEIEEGKTKTIQNTVSSIELVSKETGSIDSTGAIGNIEIINALQALALKNYDILTPQKRLKEAVDNDFLLTTEQVSQILGLNTNTIRSWKSGTQRLGFSFHKEHEGSSSVVWRVCRP